MKEKLAQILSQALNALQANQVLPTDTATKPAITPCKDRKFGDYATNVALTLTKAAKLPPRDLAQQIINSLPENTIIRKVEIAGPGFINFFLNEDSVFQIIPTVLEQAEQFGHHTFGEGKKVHIEYVSANPTGPLHVGHGRGAAYGASVASLLTTVGYDVHREYYVNDVGRQMQILAVSIWIRYLQNHAENVALPSKAYQGDYVIDIAKQLEQDLQSRLHHTEESIQSLLPKDLSDKEDPEKYLDTMILIAKNILGEENFQLVFQAGLNAIISDIREDLEEFSVTYDEWFHESTLLKEGLLEASIKLLDDHGYLFKKDGATWFRSSQFGDEKDRVLIRSNGQTTYFASDVAYHLYKYRKGYDQIVDVFGSDHHGYIARIRGFLEGLGEDPDRVKILLVQFAILYRGKEKVAMSTRSGQFVTLRELRAEVGNDAARYFYVSRKPEQHLDFDLDLAKSKSNENPVYYIQYAHARICSVWRQLASSDLSWDKALGFNYLSLLTTQIEKDLMSALMRFPEVIKTAAINYEPHTLAYALYHIANLFHSYYNAEKFILEQPALRNARLCLIAATAQVLQNGLKILGICAPERM